MLTLLGPALLMVLAPLKLPAAATEPPSPTSGQSTLLRCSAAFAIIAGEQARGAKGDREYPPLQDRGMEYFVRAATQLMDELGVTREVVDAMLRAEVGRLQEAAYNARDPAAHFDSVMLPCLADLEAAGL